MSVLRSTLRGGLRVMAAFGLARKEGDAPGFIRQSLRHDAIADAVSAELSDFDAAILDVGCGRGGLSRMLRERGFTSVKGCDWLDPGEVNADRDYPYQTIDLNRDGLSAYGDHTVDAVVCSDVLEHLENPARILAEIARVLRPRGLAFVSIPNAFNIVERLSWLATGNSTRYKRETSTQEFGHIAVLPSEVMASLSARAGLTICRTVGDYTYLDGYVILPRHLTSTLTSYGQIWIMMKP